MRTPPTAAVMALALLCLALAGCAWAQDVTTIQIADKVLHNDAIRLGINLCGDNYWDGAIVKVRAADNFEGVMGRMISWGPVQDADGIAVWFRPAAEAWEATKGKVKWTLLGGPAKGRPGALTSPRLSCGMCQC
jgi:hypothetical protein